MGSLDFAADGFIHWDSDALAQLRAFRVMTFFDDLCRHYGTLEVCLTAC